MKTLSARFASALLGAFSNRSAAYHCYKSHSEQGLNGDAQDAMAGSVDGKTSSIKPGSSSRASLGPGSVSQPNAAHSTPGNGVGAWAARHSTNIVNSNVLDNLTMAPTVEHDRGFFNSEEIKQCRKTHRWLLVSTCSGTTLLLVLDIEGEDRAASASGGDLNPNFANYV